MSTATGAKAQAKIVGEDLEWLVSRAVDGLALVDETDAPHDAVADQLLTPTAVLPFGSVCLLEAGTPVEIKACRLQTSNGEHSTTPGRWFFKGRDDGQHHHLLERGGAYLLAVYRETPDGREVVQMLLLPASIVDELLAGSWYGTGRSEGYVAKLSWRTILEDAD
ncbi:hypothetical protein [Halorubellus salinus]|uniref:hypothetical protein n=1 Tax=Halorubellus salinus TaxID=755309 RepID=UPI001D070214|nr:hypothetical protein [Halorubellus salinus]